jgi:HTH-type transcriptional regulator/antitoxin HigA
MNAVATQFNTKHYKRLLTEVMPIPIETEEDNERMLAAVGQLMEKGENLSAEEGALLRLLSTLIEDFETKFYQPEDATPLEVLRHLMEERGLKQSDLWELFGSKGIASEVLNGKRGISKAQAKKLAEYFYVPVSLFI